MILKAFSAKKTIKVKSKNKIFEYIYCDFLKDDNINHLTEIGLITLSNDRLSVNANGRLVLNRIIDKLLEDSFH